MKLFLHWLCWDLRRFRVMLLIWSALVLSYAAYLGAVQANALTVDPDWLGWSKPIASLLLVILLFFVSAIFYADPARGTDVFWKTRPPSGRAVAGAKLAIVVLFFLILPMTTWLLMKWLCVPPVGDLAARAEVNWTFYLWSVLCLCLSALAIATMSLRKVWLIPLRLGLQYVPLVTSAFGLLLLDYQHPLLALSVLEVNCSRSASFWAGAGMLLLGSVAFLWPRRPDAPFGYWVWPLLFPIVVTLMTLALPRKAAGPVRPDVPVRTGVPPTIQVNGFASRVGYPTSKYRPIQEAGQGKHWVEFSTVLNIRGTAGSPAAALWKELKLTSPDGRMLLAEAGRMAGSSFGPNLREGDVKEVNGAIFENDAAESMALLPCRAEGVIRLLLYRYEKAEWLMEAGSELATPVGTFYRPKPTLKTGSTNFEVRWSNPGSFEVTSLVHQATGTTLRGILNLGSVARESPPILMETYMGGDSIVIHPVDDSWRSLRKFKSIPKNVWFDDWTLGLRWLRPDSYLDIPVVLDPFVLPQRGGPLVAVEKILAQVPWPQEGSAEEKRWTLMAWIQLSEQSAGSNREEWEADEALEKSLNNLTRSDFPLLRDTFLELVPPPGSLKPLTKRLVELATPEELASLASLPRAIALRQQMPDESATPTPQKPKRWDPAELTEEELLNWDAERVNSWKLAEKIGEGLRRGLPWAMPAAVEVLSESRRDPSSNMLWKVIPEVLENKVPVRLKSWVVENHKKLVFDPVSRKWILPEPDKSNPAPVQKN